MNNSTIKKNSDTFDSSYLSKYETTSITNLILELKSKGIFLSKSFHDDVWLFSHEYSPGRSIKLDFNKIVVDLNKDDLLLIKYWVGSLLEKYRPSTCIHYFNNFSKAVNITNFFSLDRLIYFVKWLLEDNISDNDKTYLLSNVFSFFDFSEIHNSTDYLATLYDIRNKIKFTKNPIELTSSKYILLYTYYCEHY